MNFEISSDLESLRQKLRDFVDQRLLPLEEDRENYDAHENIRLDLLEERRAEAKERGLWAPQIAVESGGLGLSMVERAVFYEEANRSIFGPVSCNCAAPDDGNMSVLQKVASSAQKEKWLKPLIAGKCRSAFVMTEPHPGSGSDPSMMLTRATRQGGQWHITGRKWFITGAGEAEIFILMARTSDDPRRGLTAFLFHRDQPGWEVVRRIPIMGPEEHGGHCELQFDDLVVSDENRLMEVGDGLKLTQIRLGPARLTHCMRWLGLAKRCLEIVTPYLAERQSFGLPLGQRESIRGALGELAHEIAIGRLLVMHAAWKLDQGDFARKEISMAKIHVADLLHKAADQAIQFSGARGYSKDTRLEWIYRYARQARLVDGASEVHKMQLARFFDLEGDDFWRWDSV